MTYMSTRVQDGHLPAAGVQGIPNCATGHAACRIVGHSCSFMLRDAIYDISQSREMEVRRRMAASAWIGDVHPAHQVSCVTCAC
jgi:hypothetical protein